jgi:DNA-binding GntR family transcriptional regulator
VPLLRRLHRASEAVIEDAVAFEQTCRAFHDGLVEGCGNASIAHLVSALEWLWHHQDEGWAHRVAVLHEYPDVELRREGLRAHARLLAAIVAGRADEAEALARAHHASPGIRSMAQSRSTVKATHIDR